MWDKDSTVFQWYLIKGLCVAVVVGCLDFHNLTFETKKKFNSLEPKDKPGVTLKNLENLKNHGSFTHLALSQQGMYLCALHNAMICHIAWN